MANLTLLNIGICLLVAIGTFGYGFGFGVWVTALGEPGLYVYFSLDPTSTYTANMISAVNSAFAGGAAVGAIAQGWIADWLGRKKALAVAGVTATVGAALCAGSVALGMLIAARILHGFGLGMIIALVPLYITEVSPAHRRGVMTGLTCLSFGLGYVAIAFVALGTYHAKAGSVQWRLPFALACLGPFAMLFGLPFVPETPRYLSWVGRHDEALSVLRRIHHDVSDPSGSIALAEYRQIFEQVEYDKQQKSGYIQMFVRPSWRRRSLLVMFIMFASQATGVNGISNYLIIIFSTLGLTGQMPLVIYAIYAVIGTIAAFVAIFSIDKFGRRRLFLIGFPVLACNLLVEAMLQRTFLGTANKVGNGFCVAFIFLFIVLFQFIDGPSFVWCAELYPTTVRAKGIGLTMFSYFVGYITFSAPGPLGFRNIHWRMYLIYLGLCLICWVIVYFWVPETRGLPLEQIGDLFGDVVVVHITADGHDIVEKASVHHIDDADLVSTAVVLGSDEGHRAHEKQVVV